MASADDLAISPAEIVAIFKMALLTMGLCTFGAICALITSLYDRRLRHKLVDDLLTNEKFGCVEVGGVWTWSLACKLVPAPDRSAKGCAELEP